MDERMNEKSWGVFRSGIQFAACPWKLQNLVEMSCHEPPGSTGLSSHGSYGAARCQLLTLTCS